jgi:RHS repeat-associated protein
MVYDKRDRLVLTQDGNQRQDNHWTFTKYDALNRPVLTGTKTISGSRDAVQAAVNDFYEQSSPMYETRSGNWNTGDHGYTDLSYPKGISEYSYLTATYYDDYGFHGGESAYVPITGDDIDIVEHLPKPKGQATGAKVKVLGDNEFLKSSTYYDNKYRVILTRAGQYNGDHQQLLLSKAITEEGYIYIYVSNESNLNVNVYFDDLKITHTAADMVVQANDYYPFGLTMKPSDFQRDGERGNKFLYNGKELQTDLNLDWYDFHARQYMADLGRTTTLDPMAEKFYGMSPYSMMANNPIRFVDPTGMEFTESAWEWVENMVNSIFNKLDKNTEAINDKRAMLASGVNKKGKSLSEGRVKKLRNQISNLESANSDMQDALGELSELAISDQVYNVVEDESLNAPRTAGQANGTAYGKTAFNTQTGQVDIRIPSMDNQLAIFAHEAKHAHQFEVGTTALKLWTASGEQNVRSIGGLTLTYDWSDEQAAYYRGSHFGGGKTPSAYLGIPPGPIDFRSYSQGGSNVLMGNNVNQVTGQARAFRMAIRVPINGVRTTVH